MPSVVIAFVGMTVLAPFLQDYFGAPTGLNVLNAAILLALMAVPTICTISEDALRSVPRSLKESSLALGATHYHALFSIGIVLFFFTFLCNLAAFLVSQKYKLKASS